MSNIIISLEIVFLIVKFYNKTFIGKYSYKTFHLTMKVNI